MLHSCPINFQTYDATVARVTSFVMALCIALYLQSGLVIFVWIALLDIGVRLLFDKRFSPFYHVALFIKERLGLKSVKKDGASKKLATYFGLFFSSGIILFHLLHAELGVVLLSSIFIVCLLLDAFFDFCLGCKIYYVIKKIYPSFME